MRRAARLRAAVTFAALLFAAEPALLAQHGAPAAQPAPTPARVAAPVAAVPVATPAQPSDVKAVVDRIQKRIASEVGAQASRAEVGAPTGRSQPHAARGAVGPVRTHPTRIRLAWRLSLVWPAELTD